MSASSKRMSSIRALIISKLQNRLNKDTSKEIICLESWGIFIDIEEKKAKKLIIL
jgi:hypothetical protein